jgi:hypothetical protein
LDDTYPVYVNRVARMTLPDAYQAQVQHIQPSPKFQRQPSGAFQPVSFPGYSVITPPWAEDVQNTEFYQGIQTLQQQVVAKLSPELVVPIPPDSFHMTLADLIWDSAYDHASEKPGFDQQLRDRISESMQQCHPAPDQAPVYWQALGLVVMPRAIGVCLAPKDEKSYQQVLELRRALYQNLDLMALGIEQQYHFTAHVTLGYFGDSALDGDRNAIGQSLNMLTQQWLDSGAPQALQIYRAELRKFDDMTRYYREADWPVVEF